MVCMLTFARLYLLHGSYLPIKVAVNNAVVTISEDITDVHSSRQHNKNRRLFRQLLISSVMLFITIALIIQQADCY